MFWERAEPESGVKVIMDRNQGWIELHSNPDHFPVTSRDLRPLHSSSPLAHEACEMGRSR